MRFAIGFWAASEGLAFSISSVSSATTSLLSAAPRNQPRADAERIETLGRLWLRPAEGAAQHFNQFEIGRALRDRLRLGDRDERRRTMPRLRHRRDRLGQIGRARRPDRQHGVDFAPLDRVGQLGERQRRAADRGQRNVALRERRVEQRLIVVRRVPPAPSAECRFYGPSDPRPNGGAIRAGASSSAALWRMMSTVWPSDRHVDVAAHDGEIDPLVVERRALSASESTGTSLSPSCSCACANS